MYKTLLTGLAVLVCNGLHATPCYSWFDGFHSNVELLCWNAESDNLNIINETFTSGSGGSADTEKLSTTPIKYGWRPGFRVGIESQFTLDQSYAAYGNFTYYRSTANASVHQANSALTNGSVVTPFGSIAVSRGQTIDCKIDTDFLYERADAGISKIYKCSNFFSVIPRCAFSFCHLRQTMGEHDIITGGRNPRVPTANFSTIYSGYGVNLGMEAQYKVISCLSIFSSVDLSGYWGEHHFQYNESRINSLTGLQNQAQRESIKMNIGRWISDLQIGVQYSQLLFHCMEVTGRLGWEFLYLPDQVLFFDQAQSLKINGLIVGLDVGF